MAEREKIALLVDEERTVWVPWTNTDLTEGRGRSIPICAAVSLEVAARLGERRGVMGSDAYITEERAFRIGPNWFIPGTMELENEKDKAKREKREARDLAIKRAREAGLSDEDIKALMGARQ